jgi:hypothetical protein
MTEQIYLEATLTPTSDEKTGREWDVTIIGPKQPGDLVTVEGVQYVRSKNDRLYSLSAIKDSMAMWEGIKVYDNHLTQEEFTAKQGMRSPVKEWLGTIVKPYWDDKSKQLRGTFKVVEDALAGKLKNAWEQGVLGSIGLSIDTIPIIGREALHEGSRMPVIEGFKKILSVDLVGDPAAGGGFNRIIAAVQHKEELEMEPKDVQAMIDKAIDEKLGGAVKEALADALAAEAEEMEGDEVQEGKMPPEFLAQIKKKKKKAAAEEEMDDEEMEEAKEADDAAAKAAEALASIRAIESRLLLRETLNTSKLPDEIGRAHV